MANGKTNPKVDAYLRRAEQWQEESEKLRSILLDCQLTEELKWAKPCYTFEGSNIAIIQGFKESCALMFFKGSLLSDPKGILEAPGENSRVARRVLFTNVQEIDDIKDTLKDYINEAIEAEKAGLEVDVEEREELAIPEEFQNKLDENPALQTAFEELTPGRQREYVYYFSSAKQSRTREARIERYMQQILDGKGLRAR